VRPSQPNPPGRSRYCRLAGAVVIAPLGAFGFTVPLPGETAVGAAPPVRPLVVTDNSRRLIAQFGGTLERFAGDGLMVFFNDPLPCADSAAKAVCMAVAMRQRMEEIGQAWGKLGYGLDFGIGIAEGYATLGKIGFEGQFNYGAVGTVTNLAARLCRSPWRANPSQSKGLCGGRAPNPSRARTGEN
jgi:hypothetical protein